MEAISTPSHDRSSKLNQDLSHKIDDADEIADETEESKAENENEDFYDDDPQ